jgi:hypothetical protein
VHGTKEVLLESTSLDESDSPDRQLSWSLMLTVNLQFQFGKMPYWTNYVGEFKIVSVAAARDHIYLVSWRMSWK